MTNIRKLKEILSYILIILVVVFIFSFIFVPLHIFSIYGYWIMKIAIPLFVISIIFDLFYFAKDSDKRRQSKKKVDHRKIFGMKRKILFSIIEWGGIIVVIVILLALKKGSIGAKECPDIIQGNEKANLKIKYFYSPFCPYCWKSEPILREAINSKGNLFSLERYDVRYCDNEVIRYKVSGTPSYVFILKNESKEFVSYGYIPKEKLMDTILKLSKEQIHIHPTLKITICGDEIKLPYNTGTSDVHTHTNTSILHIEAKNISLGDFLKLIDLNFNNSCIDSYCNGDKCPNNKIGTLKMYVNERENNEFDRYIPNDNESIVIGFD